MPTAQELAAVVRRHLSEQLGGELDDAAVAQIERDVGELRILLNNPRPSATELVKMLQALQSQSSELDRQIGRVLRTSDLLHALSTAAGHEPTLVSRLQDLQGRLREAGGWASRALDHAGPPQPTRGRPRSDGPRTVTLLLTETWRAVVGKRPGASTQGFADMVTELCRLIGQDLGRDPQRRIAEALAYAREHFGNDHQA